MQTITFPQIGLGASTSERRKEPRYEVKLCGELRYAGTSFSVQIADISGSGALVLVENPPRPGSDAQLWIEDFGEVPVRIIHVGQYFCGVAIVHPEQHRTRLLDWLRDETAEAALPQQYAGGSALSGTKSGGEE